MPGDLDTAAIVLSEVVEMDLERDLVGVIGVGGVGVVRVGVEGVFVELEKERMRSCTDGRLVEGGL